MDNQQKTLEPTRLWLPVPGSGKLAFGIQMSNGGIDKVIAVIEKRNGEYFWWVAASVSDMIPGPEGHASNFGLASNEAEKQIK